ncbi:tryptophan 2,3-dioxygenase family protein [Wandonia haliotis]|uniref:Tryptophan 2,3-dioxygenase family protein n=1 Tax=Wandonia haliotis TaxID=574963 RepID=A0ABN1MNK8_9FLAO
MEMTPEIQKKLQLLEEKYTSIGQPTESYLEGLLYANPLGYWDYIMTDTLLSLQHPRTDFPDELIFIMYHQITELYFKLSLSELKQIAYNGKKISDLGQDKGWNEKLDVQFFTERLRRVNAYFEALTKSFDIMIKGMEPEQFLKFRMALLPASGFQSAQYRMIEICSTDLINIVSLPKREELLSATVEDKFEYIYWKEGATELESGAKTLTLKHFEQKYTDQLLKLAREFETRNIWQKYLEIESAGEVTDALRKEMRQLDVNVNINWPLVHYKSAVRYLTKNNSDDTPATGGTNWQKYLPPRFQKRIFYPNLWSDEEKDNWGKSWVDEVLAR